MTESQPDPDREKERFHNGDTLPGGIPAIRLPTVPTHARPAPPETTTRPGVRRGALFLAAAAGAVVAGVIAAAVTNAGDAPTPAAGQQPAEASASASSSAEPATTLEPTEEPTPHPPSPTAPASTEPPAALAPAEPVVVNLVSSPSTGGDIGSTYCIAWTGSSSSIGRDAVLLLEAPGYQCSAFLVTATDGQVTGPYGVMSEQEITDCQAPGTYPAILHNAWDTTFYTCLLDHTGA
ncbi:hypothetical protein RM572_00565 [Streptomyces sp. DSM 42041]|uniref:Serine/threonine protein kinase n=1 Tax=Streptomyces hazeniae TaxID=3075538 RepID=A0ABU2NNN8_9ACTN|nr:hypothetical protein [Streptomyces sp. DSM 42041]MDT0377268.1 hypothetical protein [Streptomyces sp. DSM 42041]